MRRIFCILAALLLTMSKGYGAPPPPEVSKVRFEITRVSKAAGLLHWKLRNSSRDGIYVYSFFLLGPAYNIERSMGKLVFDTTPIVRVASCPPNRVAPLLLFFVRSGGVIEGDFGDDEVKKAEGDQVSLKIAVGSEPDTVVEEAKRFYNSDCKHSPYDAVIDWAKFIESAEVRVP